MSSFSYGINSAIPTMRQLFSSPKGNPHLKASRAQKLEIGHSRQLFKTCFWIPACTIIMCVTSSDSPPHSAKLANTVQLPYGLKFRTQSDWVSKRESLDSIATFHTLPAYFTHDLALSATFKNLETELSLSNILDQNYQSEYGFPAPGRDFGIKIKYYLR
ncbi:MAG: TonB-dependent receptor [Candidatus Cloacimonetes bacterium]|nr:TonB-dependent receptor [Candidatus Cloacimonadota bacterium]